MTFEKSASVGCKRIKLLPPRYAVDDEAPRNDQVYSDASELNDTKLGIYNTLNVHNGQEEGSVRIREGIDPLDSDSTHPAEGFWIRRNVQNSHRKQEMYSKCTNELSPTLRMLLSKEQASLPKCDYFFTIQRHRMDDVMRFNLIEFISMLVIRHRYYEETLYVAINVMDRYFSSVYCGTLHRAYTIAAASFLVAGKILEEDKEPFISDIIELSRNYVTLDRRTLMATERRVMQVIGWNVHCVTPHSILYEIIKNVPLDESARCYWIDRAELLLRQFIYHPDSLGLSPSLLAASALMDLVEQEQPDSIDYWFDIIFKLTNVTKNSIENWMDCYRSL